MAGKTYFFHLDNDDLYECKYCGDRLPDSINGDHPMMFNYCPFCGHEITAWYASKEDAEYLEVKKHGRTD